MSEQKEPNLGRLIVHKQDVESVIERIIKYEKIVIDTETTGLSWQQEDRLFSIQIATEEFSAYFNFQDAHYPEDAPRLDKRAVLLLLGPWLRNKSNTLVGHNVIFDAHMLEAEGIELGCRLEDTMTRAQVLYNEHSKYSLDACTDRAGLKSKGDVMSYIEEHDLYKESIDPWSGDKVKQPDFTKLPWEIITEYGFTDVEITRDLYNHQEEQFKELAASSAKPPKILEIESGVASVIVGMERVGIRVDRNYAKQGMEFERSRCSEISREFAALAGVPFVDSVEGIGSVLQASGVVLGKTEAGSDSMAGWILEKYASNPLVKLVLEHRDRAKRGNTYFANILRYADRSGFLHASFIPRGARRTGRMSGRAPNLQNVSKGETCEFPIRKSFYPREGRCLVEIDYKAQEFRLLVEYGGERELAKQILAGYDPHQATAEMAGLSRDDAKVFNFGIPYGMGGAALGDLTGKTREEALLMRRRYYKRLPGVHGFIQNSAKVARSRGYVTTWEGCRFYFPDPNKAYQAPNRIISGGASSITKQGMVNVNRYIGEEGLKTLLMVQVHDSILLDMPVDEFEHIPHIQEELNKAYPQKIIGMDTSVEYSFESWFDLKKGLPVQLEYGQATRSQIPRPDQAPTGITATV